MSFLKVAYFIQLLAILSISQNVFASSSKYSKGDHVEIYVNKVGPYWNPQETYHYYTLPVCRPDKIEHRSLTLGEVLDGDRMAKSMYNIKFKENEENKQLCTATLNQKDVEMLSSAIEDFYYFEFVTDDIPMRGFIGKFEETNLIPHVHHMYIYTHYNFHFGYNEDRIIFANVSTKDRAPSNLDLLTAPVDLTFTYSVTWQKTDHKFNQRGKLQRSTDFFPKSLEIHWLSIINSIVLVGLLIGFVAIILSRVLRNDFMRYNSEGEGSLDDEDYGWKLISNDVFRFPKYKSLFCSVLGVGTQFLALGFGIICMSLIGLFNVHRHGSLSTAAFLLYALTSCIAGYVSSKTFKQMNGEGWVWNVNLTACLYTVPFFLTWAFINSVAWAYGSTQALPFTTIIVLGLVWLTIGYPGTVIGGIIGKNTQQSFDEPCRTKNISREIPAVPWYRTTLAHMVIGGFLPFSAISVELYYIFTTLWGRDQYTLYGILAVVFMILLCVTACISVALTYFQLASEDYRWWWRSIITSGSAAFFVLVYAFYFFVKRSNMYGGLQTIQFFGYTLLTCYMFFLMLGAVGYYSSLKFIRYIYRNIKMD